MKSHWESILAQCHLTRACPKAGLAGQMCPPMGNGPPHPQPSRVLWGWEGSDVEMGWLPYLHVCRHCGRAGAATRVG